MVLWSTDGAHTPYYRDPRHKHPAGGPKRHAPPCWPPGDRISNYDWPAVLDHRDAGDSGAVAASPRPHRPRADTRWWHRRQRLSTAPRVSEKPVVRGVGSGAALVRGRAESPRRPWCRARRVGELCPSTQAGGAAPHGTCPAEPAAHPERGFEPHRRRVLRVKRRTTIGPANNGMGARGRGSTSEPRGPAFTPGPGRGQRDLRRRGPGCGAMEERAAAGRVARQDPKSTFARRPLRHDAPAAPSGAASRDRPRRHGGQTDGERLVSIQCHLTQISRLVTAMFPHFPRATRPTENRNGDPVGDVSPNEAGAQDHSRGNTSRFPDGIATPPPPTPGHPHCV